MTSTKRRRPSGPMARPAGQKRSSAAPRRSGPPKKRKIGRKILLVLVLALVGRFAWTSMHTSKRLPGVNGPWAADSVTVQAVKSASQPEKNGEAAARTEAEPDSASVARQQLAEAKRQARIDQWFGWLERWRDKVFTVREVTVQGALSVPRDSLLARIDSLQGQPVFKLDLPALAARIASHPRIRSVAVRRHLPSTISISVEERREDLLVNANGRLLGVDRDNVVLPAPAPGWPLDVPLVTGYEGSLAVGDTVQDAALLTAASWVRRAQTMPRVYGWMSEVHLEQGAIAWVGGINGWQVEPGGHAVVAQVAALDAYLADNTAASEPKGKAKRLDLRFPGFLIVKNGG